MIRYPVMKEGTTIGVTAPSSGVPTELHELITAASRRLEEIGFQVLCGETVWKQEKAKSAPALKRAAEFNEMMQNDDVQLIFPPWGGELLIEILEFVDFENIRNKWVLGYSDTSLLLLAITLKTGLATAHGTNLVDIRGKYSDKTTAMWNKVLSTKKGDSVLQYSSEKYQKEWRHDTAAPYVFHLTEPTVWKSISDSNVKIKGRLLGGCIDVIRHLIGTEFGDIENYNKQFTDGEPILWYMENCELSTTDLRRTLIQMRLAGWFSNCSGIMFGRSPANQPVNNYRVEDVYQDLASELQIPILYDIDCGHVPPQITFVNGAYAEVTLESGKGTVLQCFN